jgi:hypothetical protein
MRINLIIVRQKDHNTIMLTQEDNLLIQSFYSTVLLTELKNNNFLNSDFFNNMIFGSPQIKGELKKIGVDNQGCALMILYAMIIVPKELFWEKFPKEKQLIEDFLQNNTVNTVTTYKDDSPKIDFLRHVRNAVAHARISFRPSEAICFSDEDTRTGATFSTELPLTQLGVFLQELMRIHNSFVKSMHA